MISNKSEIIGNYTLHEDSIIHPFVSIKNTCVDGLSTSYLINKNVIIEEKAVIINSNIDINTIIQVKGFIENCNIGKNCNIGINTKLVNCKIGNNCIISSMISLENMVIEDNMCVYNSDNKWKIKPLHPEINYNVNLYYNNSINSYVNSLLKFRLKILICLKILYYQK